MARLDPFQVARRPMARIGREVAYARSRAEGTEPRAVLFRDDAVDVDTLHRLAESAESVIEGRGYSSRLGQAEVFLGSAVLTFDPASLPIEEPVDERLLVDLAYVLSEDRRARRVVGDRIFRELSRLLGADTPADFEMTTEIHVRRQRVEVHADLEAVLVAARAATGGARA